MSKIIVYIPDGLKVNEDGEIVTNLWGQDEYKFKTEIWEIGEK